MTHPKSILNRLVRVSGAIFVMTAIISIVGSSANAQLRPWDSNNEVLVDMSVLGDSGVGTGPIGTTALPSLTGQILEPPSKMPRSRLLTARPPLAGGYSDEKLPPVHLKKPGRRSVGKSKSRKTRAKMRPKSRVAAMKSPPPKPTVRAPSNAKSKSAKAIDLAPAPKAQPKPRVKVAEAPKPSSAPPPPPAITAPKPEVKKSAPAKSQPTQQASRTSAAMTDQGMNVVFASGDAKLSDAGMKTLEGISNKLKAEPASRMQLWAYAGEPNLSASKARRLSLSRALSVRTFLISKGVRSTRIDVRALGNKVPGGQPNRVDLRIIAQ